MHPFCGGAEPGPGPGVERGSETATYLDCPGIYARVSRAADLVGGLSRMNAAGKAILGPRT
jgi:hypothetical protein